MVLPSEIYFLISENFHLAQTRDTGQSWVGVNVSVLYG